MMARNESEDVGNVKWGCKGHCSCCIIKRKGESVP